jgi:hypothetical protein
MALDIPAELQAAVAAQGRKLFDRDLRDLRRKMIEALDRFGADTGQRKQDVVASLLAGDDADATAAAVPWAVEKRERQILAIVEQTLSVRGDSDPPQPTQS